MLLFRCTIYKNKRKFNVLKEPDHEIVWVEAHNQESAMLMAIRWYDEFHKPDLRNRNAKIEVRLYTRDTAKIYPGQHYIKSWYFWHQLSDGKKIATRGYGRNEQEAFRIAKKFEVFDFLHIDDPDNMRKYISSELVED